MKNFDYFFAKEKVLLTNSNYNWRTDSGRVFTIAFSLIVISVIILFGTSTFETTTSSYPQEIDTSKHEIQVLIKYPKRFEPLFSWQFNENFQDVLIYSGISSCSDQDYNKFYNNAIKESDMIYVCSPEKIPSGIYYFTQNSDNDPKDYDILNDYDKLGEILIRHYYYNETLLLDTSEVLIDRLEINKNNNHITLNIELKKTIVNKNILVDKIDEFFWSQIKSRTEKFDIDYGNLLIFDIYHDYYHVNSVYKEKINERLVNLISIISLLHLIFYLLARPFSLFYFNYYVLCNCFTEEEIIQFNKKLNDNKTEKVDSNIFAVYNIKNYFFQVLLVTLLMIILILL